jgi:hypothetical protein
MVAHSVLKCPWKDLFVVAPASYLADSRADFQRVKKLTFDAALEDPSALHVILAVGARQ